MSSAHAILHIMRGGNGDRARLLDVEVRHLRMLAAIVEEGTVTRAGERLHITQSALSHQLSDLEDRLGVQLFSRARRGLIPTAAGHRLLAVAHDVLGRLAQAGSDFAAATAGPAAALRITTECYTCYHWLPAVMRQLQAVHPAVRIEVDASATDHPYRALAEGRIDLAIAFSEHTAGRFEVQPLFEDEWVAAMSPKHRLARQPFLRPEHFAAETAITYSDDTSNMLVFQKFFQPARVMPRGIMSVQLTEAMMELAKANLGIAVLTRWSVEPEVRAGRLAAVRLGPHGLRRNWAAVSRKQRATPAYVRDFVELLKRSIRGGPQVG